MEPRLADAPCVFATLERADCEALQAALGSFREAEGVTLILELETASRLRLRAGPRWARIKLSVHSSLAAVGFMASVAGALAAAGVSCNPVSAFHHDHLFVPWEQRELALETLRTLSRTRR
jgi:hypothetical protein